MKKSIFLVVVSLVFLSVNSHARDEVGSYSIQEALSLEQAKTTVGNQIKFYFGDARHGAVEKKFGEFKTNKKTNAFNKTDEAACQWAFFSALVALRDRALREGGNAVVNIKSNYKSNLVSDNKTFRCGAGKVVAGVALVGDVVKLKD